MAKSQVTLYGIIDSGVNYTTNVQTAVSRTGPSGARQLAVIEGGSAGIQGSRWGMRGTEDLGGGNQAIFLLESGFYSNNGVQNQGGALFGRQAWVGLRGHAGTITLGRQYDPVVDMFGPFLAAPQWGGYMTSHPSDLDNALNSRRINNSIKYRSPTWSGLTVEAMSSLGGTPGSFSTNWIWGGGLHYANGPLSFGAGYLNVHNPNVSFFGANPGSGGTSANNLGSFGSTTSAQSNPVFSGYASANRLEIVGLAAGVALGELNVNLAYSNTRFLDLGSASGPNPLNYRGTVAFNTLELNAKYRVTPALLAGASYSYTRNGGAGGRGGANYHLFGAGLDYFLSKRTDVYTIVAYEKASGTDSVGQDAVAQITGLTPSSTNQQASWRVGVRHKF
ncbi:porin [Pandoraea sp. XJJ-1]|uniref:porin n=1 Tax=Pandoraea sp. XJJ-1 TaxID=3002643 RepID=UPI00227DADAF|nr:porin [Pandoraea sp. XJJ-1]WAL85195.1 porin [Pandoraea sp. XJJ-1]